MTQRLVIPAGKKITDDYAVLGKNRSGVVFYWPEDWDGPKKVYVYGSPDNGTTFYKLHRQNGVDLDVDVEENAATAVNEEAFYCQYIKLEARTEQNEERIIFMEAY
jgi:hypothetical protein